jgi:hypothetical protein
MLRTPASLYRFRRYPGAYPPRGCGVLVVQGRLSQWPTIEATLWREDFGSLRSPLSTGSKTRMKRSSPQAVALKLRAPGNRHRRAQAIRPVRPRLLASRWFSRWAAVLALVLSLLRHRCQSPPPIRATTSSKFPFAPWLLWIRELLGLDGMAVILPSIRHCHITARS